MPHIDHTGPEGVGPRTGRMLGKCLMEMEMANGDLGVGMGKRRKSGGGKGLGKRLKSSKIFENQNTIRNEDCDTDKK